VPPYWVHCDHYERLKCRTIPVYYTTRVTRREPALRMRPSRNLPRTQLAPPAAARKLANILLSRAYRVTMSGQAAKRPADGLAPLFTANKAPKAPRWSLVNDKGGTCMVRTDPECKPSAKIAAFDMVRGVPNLLGIDNLPPRGLLLVCLHL
jgi:hypothetical protein